MYCLKEGVVLKLVEEMKLTKVESWKDDPKAAALLQIRCIIPVLEEGNLWPNRGFFLKVSDASHALYVSLSRKQNEMILANKLQLGQFIHVRKLEAADPLPLLRGVAPIPGRRPCQGTPQDIVSPTRLLSLLHPENQKNTRIMVRRGSSEYSSSCSRRSSTGWSAGKSSDDESVTAPTPPRASKRRSWSESEILGVKEIYDSSVAKNEMKLSFRSASANVSPFRRGCRYDSSDDNSSLVSRNGVAAKRSAAVQPATTKARIVQTTSHSHSHSHSHSVCNVVCDRKGGAESRISWSSLPSSLVSHGKEVIRQRDVALEAAADALQEACASERLLHSLSIMSQFPLAEGDDLQPFVDKFFNLQLDLAQTGLIMQSLTTLESNIGLERKKNANAWIKSAIALDLSPCWTTTSPLPKQTSTSCSTTRDNNSSSDHDHVDHINIPLLLGSGPEWSRGSSACAAAELASSLQDECKKLFLIYAEKYLDEVDIKSSLAEHDVEMAEMMCRVKMVSEWLNKEAQGCDSCEAQTYARVRDKIYCILLNHVDKTTMAFDRFKASL